MLKNQKIVVLDDDPTGTQTVHDVSVYTDWDMDTLEQAFLEESNLFFLLTNSRSFSEEKTAQVHREIARRLCDVSKSCGKEFILISRGDSTLRGHFPLETAVLRETIEGMMDYCFDGEIICPFFLEANRVTKDDIHYVIESERWIPAAETEFAKDATFGYRSSNLREYVEEKTGGEYPADSCMSFSIEELQEKNIPALTDKLCKAAGFQKIIVNATDYDLLETFCRAFVGALSRGRHFMMRTAASFPKVLGGISAIPLLGKEQIVTGSDQIGGVVIVGSHVGKTTKQLELLKRLTERVEYLEFDVTGVYQEGGLAAEADRIAALVNERIKNGIHTVIYTSRTLIKAENEAESLKLSVAISDAFTGIVGKLQIKPRFIIAKGGITSSDVATKALQIRHADVMGQIRPGIPVWRCKEGSLFPGLPYIIFPGNVGNEDTLYDIVCELSEQ